MSNDADAFLIGVVYAAGSSATTSAAFSTGSSSMTLGGVLTSSPSAFEVSSFSGLGSGGGLKN